MAELAGTVASACCCDVPPSLSYVDGELSSIGSVTGEAANGFALAAQDVTSRAGLLSVDESLAGAMTAAYGTQTLTAATPIATVSAAGGAAGADPASSGVTTSGGPDWLVRMETVTAPTADANWKFVAPATGAITASAGVPNVLGTALFNGTFGGQAYYTSGESAGSGASIIGHGPVLHQTPGPDYSNHGVFTIDFAGQAGSV